MNDRDSQFANELGNREKLREKGKRQGENAWFGLGMFGLVGWSFAIPVLLFLGLGIWIDTARETTYSWTLMLLAIGVFAGAANAWFWVRHEEKQIEEEDSDDQ